MPSIKSLSSYHKPLSMQPEWPVPSSKECWKHWDTYTMPANIREHSLLVARVALKLARQALAHGITVDLNLVEAAALLHDIAKHYILCWGGNHAQLGGIWTLEVTKNPALALAVTHHVYWPWHLDVLQFPLPLLILYADKRVCHNRVVTLSERFADLSERYGKTDSIRRRIQVGKAQVFELERQLSKVLKFEYHACALNSRWLVD